MNSEIEFRGQHLSGPCINTSKEKPNKNDLSFFFFKIFQILEIIEQSRNASTKRLSSSQGISVQMLVTSPQETESFS